VRAVLPLHVLDVDQADVGLVDERRRLQRVPRTFAAHISPCETTQLGVNQRHEPIERVGLTAAPGQEERRWARRLCRNAPHFTSARQLSREIAGVALDFDDVPRLDVPFRLGW